MYVQYTPSSKINLSSKILHKSLPTYFFMLTKYFACMEIVCGKWTVGEWLLCCRNLSWKSCEVMEIGRILAIKTKKVRKMLKKVQKNLEVKKKCVSLQSVWETTVVHWKYWKTKYKEASTKHKKIESVNFLEIRSAGLNLRYRKYTKKSLILAQDER